MGGELKWVKVSKAKLATYKSLVDFYFTNRHRDRLQFKAMTVDTHSADYVAFRKENHEIGYYKLYYFFLLKKLLPYAKDNDYSICVYLDDRSTNYRFSDPALILESCCSEGPWSRHRRCSRR